MKQLRHNLSNGPNHVFGDHAQCNPAFCKASAVTEDRMSSDSDSNNDDDNDTSI